MASTKGSSKTNSKVYSFALIAFAILYLSFCHIQSSKVHAIKIPRLELREEKIKLTDVLEYMPKKELPTGLTEQKSFRVKEDITKYKNKQIQKAFNNDNYVTSDDAFITRLGRVKFLKLRI